MLSLFKVLSGIERTSATMIGYSSFTLVAVLAEFLLFASWKHFVALPKLLVLPIADQHAD